MKKLNLICASIAVLFGTVANAGTLTTAISGGTVFAIENFRGTTSAAADTVTPDAVSYSLSTITAVNPGATVYFTVRLAGGLFAAAPAAGTFQFIGTPLSTTVSTTAPYATAITLSTDGTTVLVAVKNGAAGTASTITLGLGAFTYTPAAGNIASVNSTLSVVGGTVTATVGLTTVAPATLESSAGPQATVDGPLPTATIAIAAKAITGVVSPLPTYTGKIDLTLTPPGSGFTTGGQVALGSVTFTNNTGIQNVRAGGGVDYTLANGNGGANTGATYTITPGAGQVFPVGSVLGLYTTVGCTGAVTTTGTGTVAFTSATVPTAKVLTTTTPVTTGTAYFICLTPPSATNTATPITVNIIGDVAEASTTDLIDNATGAGYPLNYNGSQVDVKTYYPNALAAFGYGSYIRVINTGSAAAVISGSFITETTGVAGSSFPLSGTVAPGGAIVLRGNVIESILGAPGSADRPRLRLTAPTNGLVVQYFLQNPGGTITEISSQQ